MGVVAIADQQTVLALDRFGGADKIIARQRCRDYPVHGGGADLIALVPGSVHQKLQRACGLAAGDAKRRDDLPFRQSKQLCRRRRGAVGACGRGRVKAAGIMRGGIERVAQPAAHLITGDDRSQHVAAGAARHFADRERRRYHRRARMQRGIGVRIVEIKGMTERAVEQGCDGRRPGFAVAEYGGIAVAVQREGFEHLQKRRRRFRVAPRADRAAEKIERQNLGSLQHFPRDILEFQIGHIAGERFGFMGHGVSSKSLSRRVGGLISRFKLPCALRAAAMPDVVYKGLRLQRFGTGE